MKDYIAVDWGSTQLRGWLIRNGQCVETKQLPMGITRLNGRSPADVFAEHLAPWRGAQALPVLMAGMIGSDAGWQAVPYLDCPTAIDAPGRQLCAVAEGVWIIPGLKIEQDGDFNVMRGEETQLLGACQLAQPSLISELFVARAARVLGGLAASSVSDYLSGLLIGAEVATLGQRFRTSAVTLVGEPALNARYGRAMKARGMMVNSCSGDEALLAGMARIMHEQD